jgi:2-hydroxy-4-carboxymuconate semialdehyde hemiacetal dehydrogenase
MSQILTLSIVGAGAIAQRHLEAMAPLGIAKRLVVSRTLEEAADFANRWNFAHTGTDIEQALADRETQIVLIASPSDLHAEQAVRAMQAGKDVIVEIPVATNLADARRVAEVAQSLGRRVWVCHTMRSYAGLRIVRERIRTGQLTVTQVAGFFGIPRRRNQGMGGVGTRSWIDNLLWHHGCHQVDASLWALGNPEVSRVQALFGPVHPQLGMVLDVGVQMLADSPSGGQLITQALSYNVERPTWRLEFIGHEDVLTCIDGRLTNEAGEELTPTAPLSELTVQDREIVAVWRSGEPCEFDLAGVLPAMEVLDRAQRSAAGDSP